MSWIDEETVLYTIMRESAVDQLQDMSLRMHRLGQPVAEDRTLLAAGGPQSVPLEPQEIPGASHSPISDWTYGFATGARADARALAARDADLRAGRANWLELGGYDDRISEHRLRGHFAYLLTTRRDSNGELVRVDMRNPSLSNATTVLAAGPLVLRGVWATRDGIYSTALEDGVSRLIYLRDGRGAAHMVSLPFEGSITDVSVSSDGARLTFALSGWIESARYFEARGETASPLGVAGTTYAGVEAFAVRRDRAVSADGSSVPITVIAPRDAERDGQNPTLLFAHGSYGSALTPRYSPDYFAWLEEGGVFAICHVRGGGELGRAWHEAGREANKPNAHGDLIACGERLIELGYTSPARLGATTLSAGGLLVPPAALQRPDLFAAVVLRAATLNATRLAEAQNGANQFAEMGNPNTESGFRALYEQDSYQWIGRAQSSPDWLVTVGLNDRRVEPWMSAKFIARGLMRFGDHALVLARTDPEAGHGVGTTQDQVIEELADIYAFLLNRLCDPDFQPAD